MKTYSEILEYVNNVGSNSMGVFGGNKDGGYDIQQVPDEISRLIEMYQGQYFENYLELGIGAGGNTRLLSEFLNLRSIFLMDLFQIDYPNREINIKNIRCESLDIFEGDSHSQEAKNFIDRYKFDFVFIDGDHSYDGVKQDFDIVFPSCDNNCILCFHDTHCGGGVDTLFRELKCDNRVDFVRDIYEGTHKKGIGVFKKK